MLKCVTLSLSAFMISLSFVLVIGCLPPDNSLATANGEGSVHKTIPVDAELVISARGANASSQEEPEASSPDDDEVAGFESGGKENSEQSSLDAAMDLIQTAHEYWVDGDEEKSLEALDHAYGLMVNMDCGGDPQLIRQKEDLRVTISKRILEIYASRFRAVKGSHKAIPITMNQYVEREIGLFKNEERRFFIDAYKRSGRFRGEIVKALKQAGLPEELSWLPLIESGFKVKALSRSRALGLWQFIPSTGYKFGLARSYWIDERMDPAKSTTAAIAYLKELHAMFGDWATVLAAYNCGEGTVLRAISRQKKDYLDNFWDVYERLPNETARYYPRFLAVLAILKDPARYDIALEESDSPGRFEIVTVHKQLHLKTVAKRLGVPFEQLSALNPELRRYVTPLSPYPLKVPAGTDRIVLASLDKLQGWSSPKRGYVFHRVRRGENLSLLALKYRTSIRAIVKSNNMRQSDVIRVGQRLKIPLAGTSLNNYSSPKNRS